MAYEFRILGPVELHHDQHRVALGPPIRVAMVTAMLLQANRSVPVPRLVDAMWPGPPPQSAVANVRSHASTLRRLLGKRLVTRTRAYELKVEQAELDLTQFTNLAAAGRKALASGDSANATSQLAAALSLWRGTAGDGLQAGTSLQAQLASLEDQRSTVFEDLIEARLLTGEYAHAAADLRRQLAHIPVRERCWALLIKALYMSDDISGALAAYTQARIALQEHLGVEPGTQLRQLQRAVLNREAWLDHPVATPGATTIAPPQPIAPPAVHVVDQRTRGLPPPTNLPPDVSQLCGRDEILAELTTALKPATEVLIHGRPGVGKSALALHAAHLAADAFPDGQIAADLRGSDYRPLTAEELLAVLLHALGYPATQLPPTRAQRAATYHAIVAGKRMLILLDNVASDTQLDPLRTCHGPTLLVTSHAKLHTIANGQHIAIRPLSNRASHHLLATYAGEDRSRNEPDAAQTLIDICDRLPLALRIVGERLARRPQLPLSVLAAHLASRPLDGLQLGTMSMRNSLSAALHAAAAHDPLARDVFPQLGLVAPSAATTPTTIAGQLGEDTSRVFYALEHLTDAGLADLPQPLRYHTRGLAHTYAAELATTINQPNTPN